MVITNPQQSRTQIFICNWRNKAVSSATVALTNRQTVESKDAQRLQNRYRLHRETLLTFLSYPEVPPTNNESEQALRGSVVHRKVTNGFRSEWGAKAYAALQTVIATAKHKGEDLFQTRVNLMGAPVLHFLDPSPL